MAVAALRAADVGVIDMKYITSKKTVSKNHASIKQALALASCTLLGISHAADLEEPSGKADIGNWDIKSAVLVYAEADDRVMAIEPVFEAKKQIDSEESITLKLTLDTLTGASATGAVPTDSVQTFTRPSGNGSYDVAAGETPLDDTFKDTRVAFNASWARPLNEDYKMVLGTNVSKEYDYTSAAINAVLSRDFNQRNTTVSAGLSYAFDQIEPEGGIPIAFAPMDVPNNSQPRAGSSEDRDTLDLLVGLTQIIDRNSLLQLNYSYSQSDGYHTDPFKILSVVGADGRPILTDLNSNLSVVLFENRPDERKKHGVFGAYKRYLGGDVLTSSLRYSTDDWEVDSITADVRYRWKFSDTSYLQPHVRVYQQSAAEFYTPFLLDGVALPDFATADYRLGEFNAYTAGITFGRDNILKPWGITFEYYLQTGDEPDGKFGELLNQELFPDVSAIMLRFNYDF